MEAKVGDFVWFQIGNMRQNWGRIESINRYDDGLIEIKDFETNKLYLSKQCEITGYCKHKFI